MSPRDPRPPRRLLRELAALALLFAALTPFVLSEMRPLEARRVAREFLLSSPEVRTLLGEDVSTTRSLRDFLIRVELGVASTSEQGFGLSGSRGSARARVYLCRANRGARWQATGARIERGDDSLELRGPPCTA